MPAELQEQLLGLPNRSGVYVFKDAANKTLYVGKAVSLKKRVRSYFSTRKHDSKTAALVGRIQAIEYFVTMSEAEALLLEHNLIKQNNPPYNVIYRDDKSYPYIAVSVGEEYPRVRYTRERHRPGVRYFGPYANARCAKETLETLVRIFPIRSCLQTNFSKARRDQTPCLYYHIGRCAAPCVDKIDKEGYGQLTKQIVAFLEGRQEQVIADLSARMRKAAGELAFEKAAALRDRISFAANLNERQRVTGDVKINEDAVALALEDNVGCLQVLKIRNGKLIGSEDFILDLGWESDITTAFASFIKQHYLTPGIDWPRAILLPLEIPEKTALEAVIRDLAKYKVELLVPKRGRRVGLVEMAKDNAGFALERYKISSRHESKQITKALAEIGSIAGMPTAPLLIECYDISNISGSDAVGSMVVFESGSPRKNMYRRFAIRGVEGSNDYAMMKEVLRRRMARLKLDPAGRFALRPDLIIVDGGLPQLRAAAEALAVYKIEGVTVIGLAKKQEDIYRLGAAEPARLSPGAGLYLLKRIRDEAHRFAVTYHRERRRRRLRASALDDIKGIGPRRKSALLRHFGSLRAIARATADEVASAAGVSLPKAREIVKVSGARRQNSP